MSIPHFMQINSPHGQRASGHYMIYHLDGRGIQLFVAARERDRERETERQRERGKIIIYLFLRSMLWGRAESCSSAPSSGSSRFANITLPKSFQNHIKFCQLSFFSCLQWLDIFLKDFIVFNASIHMLQHSISTTSLGVFEDSMCSGTIFPFTLVWQW